MLGDELYVLSLAETKINNSFPTSQFHIQDYKIPFYLDVSDKSGGLLVYVKIGIPTRRLLSFSLPQDIQVIAIELRLKRTRWLAIFIYRPPSQDIDYFLNNLGSLLDTYSNLKNCIIMGDFNCEPSSPKLDRF